MVSAADGWIWNSWRAQSSILGVLRRFWCLWGSAWLLTLAFRLWFASIAQLEGGHQMG